jgi:hypothetical protein
VHVSDDKQSMRPISSIHNNASPEALPGALQASQRRFLQPNASKRAPSSHSLLPKSLFPPSVAQLHCTTAPQTANRIDLQACSLQTPNKHEPTPILSPPTPTHTRAEA